MAWRCAGIVQRRAVEPEDVEDAMSNDNQAMTNDKWRRGTRGCGGWYSDCDCLGRALADGCGAKRRSLSCLIVDRFASLSWRRQWEPGRWVRLGHARLSLQRGRDVGRARDRVRVVEEAARRVVRRVGLRRRSRGRLRRQIIPGWERMSGQMGRMRRTMVRTQIA